MEISKNPLVRMQCHLGWHNHAGALTPDEQQGMFQLINSGDVDVLLGFFLCSATFCTGCGKVTDLSLAGIIQQVNSHLKKHPIN